jgi:hypothetical protein
LISPPACNNRSLRGTPVSRFPRRAVPVFRSGIPNFLEMRSAGPHCPVNHRYAGVLSASYVGWRPLSDEIPASMFEVATSAGCAGSVCAVVPRRDLYPVRSHERLSILCAAHGTFYPVRCTRHFLSRALHTALSIPCTAQGGFVLCVRTRRFCPVRSHKAVMNEASTLGAGHSFELA